MTRNVDVNRQWTTAMIEKMLTNKGFVGDRRLYTPEFIQGVYEGTIIGGHRKPRKKLSIDWYGWAMVGVLAVALGVLCIYLFRVGK